MAETVQILCSRCGTAFPQERGNHSVTCVVCGQLRPDLDLTLEDDDDEGLADGLGTAAGGPTGVAHTALSDYEAGPHVLTSPVQALPEPETFRVDRPFVAMSESKVPAFTIKRATLAGALGPVVLVVPALAAAVVCGMHMLYLAPDFSTGVLYAVGTVAGATLIASLIAGLLLAKILFVLRVRSHLLLRLAFLLAAGAIAYLSFEYAPAHVQIRDNAMPGIRLTR